MSGDSDGQIYEIEVEYTDAGLRLLFDMENWYDKIEEDFGSFQSIKNFYRTDPQEVVETITEEVEEVDPDEPSEGSAVVMKNPPKEWKEDFTEAAQIIEQSHRIMVQMGLGLLIEDEVEAQEALLQEEQYKPLIVRQSAFYEELLTLRVLLSLQMQKEDALSSKELELVEGMGHSDRLRFARLHGVLDEDEHGILQDMASKRNKAAHTPWPEFSEQEESQLRGVTQKVHSLLKAELEQSQEEVAEAEGQELQNEFDIGFTGLDIELQNLQLGILSIVAGAESPVPLSYVQGVLPEEDEPIAQRSLRMDEIGYLEMDEDKYLSLTEQGEELLEEHWPNY